MLHHSSTVHTCSKWSRLFMGLPDLLLLWSPHSDHNQQTCGNGFKGCTIEWGAYYRKWPPLPSTSHASTPVCSAVAKHRCSLQVCLEKHPQARPGGYKHENKTNISKASLGSGRVGQQFPYIKYSVCKLWWFYWSQVESESPPPSCSVVDRSICKSNLLQIGLYKIWHTPR